MMADGGWRVAGKWVELLLSWGYAVTTEGGMIIAKQA